MRHSQKSVYNMIISMCGESYINILRKVDRDLIMKIEESIYAKLDFISTESNMINDEIEYGPGE